MKISFRTNEAHLVIRRRAPEGRRHCCLYFYLFFLSALTVLASVVTSDTSNNINRFKSTARTQQQHGDRRWLAGAASPFDWQPPASGRWRRVSVDNDDHEQQQQVADEYSNVRKSSKQLRHAAGEPSARLTRQVADGSNNVHILSQEHVILDHHSNARRRPHYLSSPRSLMFIQSPTRSTAEGKFGGQKLCAIILRTCSSFAPA